MKPKNTICLWFDKDALEAARFYAATFPDSEVTAVHKAPGDYPSGKEGDVLTVEFTVLGIPCLGLNGGPEFKHSEAFSFQIATDSQEETDRYWNAIVGNGGQESQCGWCKDRWGLSWQITPRALMDAFAAGGAEAKRAFDGDDVDDEDRRRHHRGRPAGLTDVEASGQRIRNLHRWLRRRSRPGSGQSDGRRRHGAAPVGLRHEDVPEDGRRLRRIADR